MLIVITIPAFNEEATIGKVISDIKDTMRKTHYKYKVLVVDDGSTDKTAEISKKSGAIVFSHPRNYGLADTFRTELQKCLELKAEIIVHTDADGQYRAADIPKLLREIEKGYDLVLGDRFAGGIESMPLLKRCGNKAFSKVISRIISYKVNDCQTGFRAFTREVAEKVRIISSHSYTQEQIIRAVKQKYRIKEVPVFFLKRKDKSRLISNPFGYAFKAWINILRTYRDYEPLKFFGIIGAVFIGLGMILGLWLLSLYIRFGEIGHYPTIMLAVLLIISGVQISLFGFFADMHRK